MVFKFFCVPTTFHVKQNAGSIFLDAACFFVCDSFAKFILTFLRWHYPNQVPGRALQTIVHYLYNLQAPLSKQLPVSC